MAKFIIAAVLLHLAVFLALTLDAEADQCSKDLPTQCKNDGECGPQCNQQIPGSKGYCVGFKPEFGIQGHCTCSYNCGSPDPRQCRRGGGGNCSVKECGNDCCNQRCASLYPNGGSGHCEDVAGLFLCTCYSPC